MYAFGGRAGRILIQTFVVAAFAAAPAAAQHRQARSQAEQQQQSANDDVRLSTEVGFEYLLSPQWRLVYDTRLLLNQGISSVRLLELRPGVEYDLSPNWAVVGGYVQFQRFPAQVPTTRGAFED